MLSVFGDSFPSRILGRTIRFLLVLAVVAHAALGCVVLLCSLALLRTNPPVTALMVFRALTTREQARPVRYVPLRQIPKPARDMIVRLEDFKFYRHWGIDLAAIRDAFLINQRIGYTLYGGSTITQQLARNLFLTPRKTYFRKYLEALIAIEMDLVLSKDRILELYLNCIEWGKGTYGIGAASLRYYGERASELSLEEQRRLVTIITAPLRYDVNTFYKSRQMAERYRYLVARFPDPVPEPQEPGPAATSTESADIGTPAAESPDVAPANPAPEPASTPPQP